MVYQGFSQITTVYVRRNEVNERPFYTGVHSAGRQTVTDQATAFSSRPLHGTPFTRTLTSRLFEDQDHLRDGAYTASAFPTPFLPSSQLL